MYRYVQYCDLCSLHRPHLVQIEHAVVVIALVVTAAENLGCSRQSLEGRAGTASEVSYSVWD